MRLLETALYKETIKNIGEQDINWNELKHKTFLISGATGMIGSFLIDVLMYRNMKYKDGYKIIALGRNYDKGAQRFKEYLESEEFEFIQCDINEPLDMNSPVDFILHLASSTHPLAYSNEPIKTITSNIIGTFNLLNYATKHECQRFIFASSVEIYGENRGDIDKFKEDYCGYIDCNSLRAGYTESKRAGEALCQAFIKQTGLDIVIPRMSRAYGPTMLADDSKAISQFIKKGVENSDVVLKSEGTQLYSYCYVADIVSALCILLIKGKSGEAYNIADESSDIMLKDLAAIIAAYNSKKVVFELPNAIEKAGYSKATKALLDAEKIKELGWHPTYDMKSGLENTIAILRALKK